MSSSLPSAALPTKDQYTTYDYDVGAKRMSDAREGKLKFLERLPGNLLVTGPGLDKKLRLVPKDKTLKFATRSIYEWGREYAEKVLSATETGSLYFNILHHYGSYDELLKEVDKKGKSESADPKKEHRKEKDYEVGVKRMVDARAGKFKFLEMLDVQCPGMPGIINFSEQVAYLQNSSLTTASMKLWVTGPGLSKELLLLSKDQTLEFAANHIEKWGRERAEKELSSTETGSLYFHIIHHFGSYDNLLKEIDRREVDYEEIEREELDYPCPPSRKRKRDGDNSGEV